MFVTTSTEALVSTDGTAWTDVTGTSVFTSGNWHLVNFNDYIIGFQQDEAPLVYDGTDCEQVTDSSAPTGGAGTAAFGRVWASDGDGTTLQYSALLDHTDWSSADAGSFDLTNVFPTVDTIVAVAQHNNLLIVFGTSNILVYQDGTGSEVGIDPTQMVLLDSITGIGCYSQESICPVNGDLWFVSNSREIVALERVLLEQKSGSIKTLSHNISDSLRDSLDSGSFDNTRLRAAFSPADRFYLLALPSESSSGAGDEVGKTFVLDTRGFLEDGSARVMGIWNNLVPTVIIPTADGNLLMALKLAKGEIGKYSNPARDDGENFTVDYQSGWIEITEEGYELILKRITGRFYLDIQTSAVIKWAFDFDTVFTKRPFTFSSLSTSSSEWGSAEWGVAEWGGGISLKDKKMSGKGTGKYIKLGMEATINGGEFSIQQFDIFAKLGRLA
jgi:hypothetical protein